MTHLHRRQPERNMARFYAMTIERSLFGHFLLIRCGAGSAPAAR